MIEDLERCIEYALMEEEANERSNKNFDMHLVYSSCWAHYRAQQMWEAFCRK